MRIDSRLMKTDIELNAIERREDRLLMLSPPDDWNATKVYLSPQDVVKVVQISLNRGMVTYLLLFPFFLVAHYLRNEKDVNDLIYDAGYLVSVIFMGLLLIGGATFLLAEPLTSAMVLGVLAALIYIVAILEKKFSFLYLAIPFTVIAHFLLGYGRGIPVRNFPWLALGVVLTLLVVGKAIGSQHQGKLARPFYHVGYLLVLIFVIYIAFNARAYATVDPWVASLPLLSFAFFHFIRYLDTREVLQQYTAALLLGGGFLFALYGIPSLPASYYGLPLIGLSMAMILIADRYHEDHGLMHVAPTYSVAILIALLAFVYAWQDLTALMLSLALFSVHFFGGTFSLGIKSTAENWGEKTFQWTEFAMANVAAGVAALLMLTIGRDNWAAIVAAGVYVYYYRKMGFGREPTILVTRNQYLWVAGGFYALFVFVVLGFWDPFQNAQQDMLLVPPLLLPLLLYGRYVQRRGEAGPAASILESSLLTVATTILLPTVLEAVEVGTASIVAGILALLYGFLWLLWRDEILLYALPMLAANLIYNGATASNMADWGVGLVFLPFALAAMVVALMLWRRGTGPVRTLFIAWFIFSGASVLGVVSDRTLTLYLISGWAALYFLVASILGSGRPGAHDAVGLEIVESGTHV